MPPSVVDAPVSYAIAPLKDALEKAVPRSFGSLEQRITVKTNTRRQIAFAATRTPFKIDFQDGRLRLTTTVSYQGKGWYKPVIGPTVSASCGMFAPQPRLNVSLASDVTLSADWRLVTHTRVTSVTRASDTPRDACKVTFLEIDVADQVVNAVGPLLTSRLPAVDRGVSRIDVKARITKWFALLQRNIRITDSLWLQLAPERVQLGEIALTDSTIVAPIRLSAHPRLVSGAEPPPLDRPLPPLSMAKGDVGDSVRLYVEGLLAYDDASAVLQKQLAGRKLNRLGRSVRIDSVRLYPLDDGRVVLAVQISGGVTGLAYFVGTPQLDRATRTLVVPDLDFDVATSDALVSGLAWLRRGDLVERLRRSARFPLDGVLEKTRQRVESALNRDLTQGVELSGEVRTGRLVDVLVHPRWLVIRAEASGTLALDVDRPLRVRTLGTPAPRR
jgi:hypothetical protein